MSILHSLTLVWQRSPVHPGGHWQLYSPRPSTHFPPCRHSCPAQSSSFTSQFRPGGQSLVSGLTLTRSTRTLEGSKQRVRVVLRRQLTGESFGAFAVVLELAEGEALAAALAGVRLAGDVLGLAVPPRPPRRARARVPAVRVAAVAPGRREGFVADLCSVIGRAKHCLSEALRLLEDNWTRSFHSPLAGTAAVVSGALVDIVVTGGAGHGRRALAPEAPLRPRLVHARRPRRARPQVAPVRLRAQFPCRVFAHDLL